MTQEKTQKNNDKKDGRFFSGWWSRNKVLLAAVFIAVMLFCFKLYGDSI